LALVLAISLALPGPTPGWASSADNNLAIGATIIGVIGTAAIAYGLWENSPGRQGQPRYLNGEFYVGGFLGASFVPDTSWKYIQGFGGNVTAKNVRYQPGVDAGLKMGYFLNSYPWFGMELETNFTRNDVRSQQASLSRSVGGFASATLKSDDFYVWTNAFKFIARYGFLPDSDVPFGRLQPYIGVGPGFVVIYAKHDAAKNFSLEVQGGVRYMMLKNVSAFVEYKYSKQWNVELELQGLWALPPNPGGLGQGTTQFDFDSHKVVAGVAYHF
jgi:opacity protein-like surface antigen